MKRSAIRIYHCAIVCAIVCGSGCKRGSTCMTGTSSIKADIVSIDAPAHINVGERATITVAVRNNSPYCVKGAKADINNKGFDSLFLTAALEITADMATKDCDCKHDSVIYTLVYFKPLDPGTYRVVSEKDSSISSANPGESVGFSITVE